MVADACWCLCKREITARETAQASQAAAARGLKHREGAKAAEIRNKAREEEVHQTAGAAGQHRSSKDKGVSGILATTKYQRG